jgi:hypothetical protein
MLFQLKTRKQNVVVWCPLGIMVEKCYDADNKSNGKSEENFFSYLENWVWD